MYDDSVAVVQLSDGSLVKVLPGIPTARGVAVADALGRIFVTSSPNQLVIIDSASLTEISRVTTGNSPDGVAWDPVDQIVGVTDQGDGAVSLIANAGSGVRTQVPIGTETGNVVHDASRGRFWVTVVNTVPPDQLVAIDPVAATVTTRIDLPGCSGARWSRARSILSSIASILERTRSPQRRSELPPTFSLSTPATIGYTWPPRAVP